MPYLRRKVFYDTQVIAWANRGLISTADWTLATRYVAAQCRYCVSFITFCELIDGLAGGDEAHFEENKLRVALLSRPSRATYLCAPGDFVRTTLFNERPIQAYISPRAVNRWTRIITKAIRREDLLETGITLPEDRRRRFGYDLSSHQSQLENGKRTHCEALRDLQSGALSRPGQPQWAGLRLRQLGLPTTPRNIRKLAEGLDAAWHYEDFLYEQATGRAYDFSKHDSDWLDCQQLHYLADPTTLFVTRDSKLKHRISGSTQSDRVVDFETLVSMANSA